MIIFHLRYKQNIQRLTPYKFKIGLFQIEQLLAGGNSSTNIDFLFDEIPSTLAGIHLSILIFHTLTLLYLKYVNIR